MTESGNGYRADLLALPTDWRLVRVGRHKEPIAGDNWFDADNFSGDEAAGLPGSGPPAWGLKSGPVSGVVVLDLDAEGWRESFQQETCHPITDLPTTIGWTSGKSGRSGHAFQVDQDWWPHLANRRCWVNANGRTCWELRGDRHQSVILGSHPETSGYRWLPGRSPDEIPDPAAAPDWLLEALLVQELPNLQPLQSNEDDAARAAAMLEHLPAADYCSYDSWLRVGMALHHTDPGLLADWVIWCKAMPNFDEAECLAKWKSFGKGHKGQPATIATLCHLAKQYGYREPKRSRKPDVSHEHQKTHPAAAASAHVAKQQQEGETNPREGQRPRNPVTPAEMLADLQSLAVKMQSDRVGFAERLPTLRHRAGDIGLTIRDSELLGLLSAARRRRLGVEGLLGPGDVLDLSPEPWAWGGLLLRGCLNLLVAEPKQGKTSLLIAMIAAWHHGAGTFLGRELNGPCPPVLLIGTDQGQADWGRMLQPAGLLEGTGKTGRILAPIVGLAHSGRPVHLDPEGIDMIAEKAQQHPGLLVVIDSLSACIAPLGLKEESPEIAMPVAELMEQLEPHGATVALIHHASKGRAGDSATRASRGSTALPALASQILKLAPATPNNPRDNRRLLTTEGRGGSPQALVIEREGSTWVLHGGIDDLEQERQQAAAIDGLTDRQAEALEVLRDRWAGHQQRTTAADVVDALGLTGSDPQGAARQTLQQLERKRLAQSTRLPSQFGKKGAHAFWPTTETMQMPSRGGFKNHLGCLRSLRSDPLALEDPQQTDLSDPCRDPITERTETTETKMQAPAREGEGISVVAQAVDARPATTTDWVRLALGELGLAPHVAMVSRVMAWLEQNPEQPACTRSAVTTAMARLQEEDNDNETAALLAA
ncbi:AAA family ATPase [Cyanobium sp. ATX 6E8]|uniref:PriCT-2 domain-containing protein n=1 Tax=Cyanobium sp. ATX 6E8 TaxID=2823701 RepID=UPI0020CC1577|nr:AAA family ATPase [Cyanobium sp. ATX 6E8]MCP9940977.1 AAA family ATPase [Cyanobium sp. ATX 6E8]